VSLVTRHNTTLPTPGRVFVFEIVDEGIKVVVGEGRRRGIDRIGRAEVGLRVICGAPARDA